MASGNDNSQHAPLSARQHSHDVPEGDTWETEHWGYYTRTHPCTNDPESCDYLDHAYWSHDQGMIYVAAIWGVVLAALVVMFLSRVLRPNKSDPKITTRPEEEAQAISKTGTICKVSESVASTARRYLLPGIFQSVFHHASRLQVLLLVLFTAYLTVFTFVGIGPWRTWVTPVRDMEGVYNTRTTLGPWTNRLGTLAYGLMPLSILLANRESFLSAVTGVPYHHFNFLHRWLGYVIALQTTLHSFGRVVVDGILYKPQPQYGLAAFKEWYMIWGVVGMILMAFLYILTLPPIIRLTGYEFFRKSHYVLAMVFVGACIGHWVQLQVFMLPTLCIWGIDRFLRLARTVLLHFCIIDGKRQFTSASAEITLFPNRDGDIVRLDFRHPHKPWKIGQHFFLTFLECSIWQAHPFSSLSLPIQTDGFTLHSYVFRARGGETRKIARLVAKKLAAAAGSTHEKGVTHVRGQAALSAGITPVILGGPYGQSIVESLGCDANVLCVAGGTGIAYVLPVILSLARNMISTQVVQLTWVIRRFEDRLWIEKELATIANTPKIKVQIFVTREAGKIKSPTYNADTRQGRKDSRLPTAQSVETAYEASGTSFEAKADRLIRSAEDRRESNPPGVNGTDKTAGAQSLQVVYMGELATSKDGSSESNTIQHHHPVMSTILNDFLDSTVSGATAVYTSGPGGMTIDLRKAVAKCNDGGMVWRGNERHNVYLKCDDRLER